MRYFWASMEFFIRMAMAAYSFIYVLYRIPSILMLSSKAFFKKKMVRISDPEIQKIVILCNGPSMDRLALKEIEGIDCMAVNYSVRNLIYNAIQPKYHCIIDSKLLSGEWGTLIEEIKLKNPKVIFVLNASWTGKKSLLDRIGASEIIWIEPCIYSFSSFFQHLQLSLISWSKTSVGFAGGVLGAALSASLKEGYRQVDIYGHDCDGLFREIVGENSHAASTGSPMAKKRNFVREILMALISLIHWREVARSANVKRGFNIRFINMSVLLK